MSPPKLALPRRASVPEAATADWQSANPLHLFGPRAHGYQRAGFPSYAELGADLLTTSPARSIFALARPWLWSVLFVGLWQLGWWPLALVAGFLVFSSVVSVAHDAVHGSLGVRGRLADLSLFLTGLPLFASAHAYRVSHIQHHSMFPHRPDPEGDPARMPMWKAVAVGPIFLGRMWLFAWRRLRDWPAQRAWLLLELTLRPASYLVAVVFFDDAPWLLAYVIGAHVGSWIFPLFTVLLPHRALSRHVLGQTRTLRGVLLPLLFIEATYHLEHHLYPAVPSHRMSALARRIEPLLRARGVRTHRII